MIAPGHIGFNIFEAQVPSKHSLVREKYDHRSIATTDLMFFFTHYSMCGVR